MSEALKKKDLFRVALATEGISVATWARRNGVTPQAVYQCLSGKMTSDRLSRRAARYIARQLRKHMIKVGAQV